MKMHLKNDSACIEKLTQFMQSNFPNTCLKVKLKVERIKNNARIYVLKNQGTAIHVVAPKVMKFLLLGGQGANCLEHYFSNAIKVGDSHDNSALG